MRILQTKLLQRISLTTLLWFLLMVLWPIPTAFAEEVPAIYGTHEIPGIVIAGQTVTFTYQFENGGYGDFLTLELVDNLPEGTQWVSGGTYDESTHDVTIGQGALPDGESTTFVYAISVPEALAGTQLTTENVTYRFTKANYNTMVLHDRFVHTINIVEESVEPTAIPATPIPDQPTATPTVAPTAVPTSPPGTQPKPVIKIDAPAVAHPGKQLTYKFTVENQGNATLHQLEDLNVPLPENVTYKSGGTYDAENQLVTYPSIVTLAPDAEQTMELVVEVPQDAQVNSTIDAPILTGWYPSANRRRLGVAHYPPGKSTIYQEGTILATYKNTQGVDFDPQIHGYSFQNYTNRGHEYADDLGAADIFDLFGPTACQTGATRDTCQLTTTGQKWVSKSLNVMNGGHCEGMAVTAQRFFEGLPFIEKVTPGDFQSEREDVFDLTWPEQNVENYVASYFVRQTLNEVFVRFWLNLQNMTPSEMVDKLIEEFNQTPSVGYTIGLFKPNYKAGHAVTPYAVEQVPDTEIYRIVVYDNNFPGQKRYIIVDKSTDSWRYIAAADPSQPASLYEGNTETKTLGLSALSTRDNSAGRYFTCPFCSQPATSVTAAQDTPNAIEIGFSGEGELLVIDDEDRFVGYDFFDREEHVNDIPGAEAKHQLHGLGLDLPAVYRVPYLENDGLYEIYVGGVREDDFTDGDLTIAGPNFVMGVEYLTLEADEMYRIDIYPDGNGVYVEATADSLAPRIYMSFDPEDETSPGIEIAVDFIFLKAGEVAHLYVDREQQIIDFVDQYSMPLLNRDISLTIKFFQPEQGGEAPPTNGDEIAMNEVDTFITIPKGARLAYVDYSNWQEDPESVEYVMAEYDLFLPIIQR